MKTLSSLFSNWNTARFLRLFLGLVIMAAYIAEGDALYLGLSVFLLVQALMNIGCGCSSGACSTNYATHHEELETDLSEHEENK